MHKWSLCEVESDQRSSKCASSAEEETDLTTIKGSKGCREGYPLSIGGLSFTSAVTSVQLPGNLSSNQTHQYSHTGPPTDLHIAYVLRDRILPLFAWASSGITSHAKTAAVGHECTPRRHSAPRKEIDQRTQVGLRGKRVGEPEGMEKMHASVDAL